MKRITVLIESSFLIPDETEPLPFGLLAGRSLLDLDGIETLSIVSAHAQEVREGICRVGLHRFAVSRHLSGDRPVPDICGQHAGEAAVREAVNEHAPLFTEVERLTGLRPRIWQTGGMTMTIAIPLMTAEDQAGSAPLYMGLCEGQDEQGRWYGTVGFYLSEEAVLAVPEPLPPTVWALKIADHYHRWRQSQPDNRD